MPGYYTAKVSKTPRVNPPPQEKLDLASVVVFGEIDLQTHDERVTLWIRNEGNDKRTVLSFDRDQATRVAKAMLKLANREA